MDKSMSTDPLYPKAKLLAAAIEPYLTPVDSKAPVSADVNDLLETSRWLIANMADVESHLSSADSLETFLVNLDIQLDHIRFHAKSLKATVNCALGGFPAEPE
jgi:hypothetical protein